MQGVDTTLRRTWRHSELTAADMPVNRTELIGLLVACILVALAACSEEFSLSYKTLRDRAFRSPAAS